MKMFNLKQNSPSSYVCVCVCMCVHVIYFYTYEFIMYYWLMTHCLFIYVYHRSSLCTLIVFWLYCGWVCDMIYIFCIILFSLLILYCFVKVEESVRDLEWEMNVYCLLCCKPVWDVGMPKLISVGSVVITQRSINWSAALRPLGLLT